MNRRDFLHHAGSLGGLSLAASTGLLTSLQAHAAPTNDYRALICVFLYGGNDGMNMVVPYDATRYTQYSTVRGALALPQADLLPIGTQYALHPGLAPLQSLWTAGQLAPVFNVGPLAVPLLKADFVGKSKAVPDNLFSHSDQQTLWQTGGPSVLSRTGWGGRVATAAGVAPAIAFGSPGRFGHSTTGAPLALPGPGDDFAPDGYFGGPNATRRAALEAIARQARGNQMLAGFSAVQATALDRSASFGPVLAITPTKNPSEAMNAPFQNLTGALASPLAKQLYQVAKLIEQRAALGSGRQVFIVSQGGYDNHANQLPLHAALMADLGNSLAAFHSAMQLLGVADKVTSFTMSDFGRTFKPNDSAGTDHAWGNNHLVIGAAVKGGATYGAYPELTLGGPNDVGDKSWERQGRWIPTTSVDQYAATLASWFGLDDATLAQVFPSLANFSVKKLGFMNA